MRLENAIFVSTLGRHRYLSLMRENIGDRQKGRPQAASVLNCSPARGEIASAVRRAFELDCSAVSNPYGDGHTAERIVRVLATLRPGLATRKPFVDVGRAMPEDLSA